jgi:hypothetical protein
MGKSENGLHAFLNDLEEKVIRAGLVDAFTDRVWYIQ